jgi:CheY-like chemotaxis protein/anti-sigma regulatory factor (Ser/Thr protein kinase)
VISGKLRLDVQPVDLSDVIAAAVESVTPAAEAKQIRLTKVLGPLAGPVSGDPSRLQQVVWNLLSNSIKFTPRGGKVHVALERVNSHLEISVVDTGEGIAPEFLPHAFERFRQADASTTRRQGGLGIGLSLVKQLTELHGGTVRVKSPGVGKRSTFTVALPLLPIHADAEQRTHPRAASAPGGATPLPRVSLDGLKVLVVDDEPDARAVAKRVLEGCGAEVVAAASAEQGPECLRRERPGVVLSDIGMPGHDGYEFIRRVRRLGEAEGGSVPAAALTAYARSEDRQRALLAGYQSHLVKPVDPGELVTVVASLAGRTGEG